MTTKQGHVLPQSRPTRTLIFGEEVCPAVQLRGASGCCRGQGTGAAQQVRQFCGVLHGGSSVRFSLKDAALSTARIPVAAHPACHWRPEYNASFGDRVTSSHRLPPAYDSAAPGHGNWDGCSGGGGAWRKRVGRFAVWGAETLGRSLCRHQTLRGWPNNKP